MNAAVLSNSRSNIYPWDSFGVPTNVASLREPTDLLGSSRKRGHGVWLDSWSRVDGYARMVVTADRQFVCGDRSAEDHLKQRRYLHLQGPKVEPVHPALFGDFKSLLEVDDEAVNTACLALPGDQSHLILRATRLEPFSECTHLAVAFRHADSDCTPQWAGLRQAFDLTLAEERVLVAMLCGASPKEVARQLQVSIATVRTHISHIYSKLDVTRKESLWSRCQSFRVS